MVASPYDIVAYANIVLIKPSIYFNHSIIKTYRAHLPNKSLSFGDIVRHPDSRPSVFVIPAHNPNI